MDTKQLTTRIPTGVLHHKVVLRQSPPAPIAFTAASYTQTIFLFGLPAKHVVVGIVAKLVTTFAATGLSNCTMTVGSTSQVTGTITSTNFLMPSFVCTQAPSPGINYGPIYAYPEEDMAFVSILPLSIGDTASYPINYFVNCTVTPIDNPGHTVICWASSAGAGGPGGYISIFGDGIGNTTGYWAGHDVIFTRQPVTTPFMYWSPFVIPNNCIDPQDIQATFTSTGAHLSALTAGEVELTIMYAGL